MHLSVPDVCAPGHEARDFTYLAGRSFSHLEWRRSRESDMRLDTTRRDTDRSMLTSGLGTN